MGSRKLWPVTLLSFLTRPRFLCAPEDPPPGGGGPVPADPPPADPAPDLSAAASALAKERHRAAEGGDAPVHMADLHDLDRSWREELSGLEGRLAARTSTPPPAPPAQPSGVPARSGGGGPLLLLSLAVVGLVVWAVTRGRTP